MYNKKYGDIDLPDKVTSAAELIASQLGGMDYSALDALRAKLGLSEGENQLMSNHQQVGLLHLVIGATKTHGITAILEFKGVAAVPIDELLNAENEPSTLPGTSEADGIAAIIGLQKAAGEAETEEQAREGWNTMSDGEKLSTMEMWRLVQMVPSSAGEDGVAADMSRLPGVADRTDGM